MGENGAMKRLWASGAWVPAESHEIGLCPRNTPGDKRLRSAWGADITDAEITAGMGNEAPGVVLILGCQGAGFQEVFTAKGCKIFFGFTGDTAGVSGQTGRIFMNALFAGKTILQAKGDAWDYFKDRALYGETMVVYFPTGKGSETMYKVLEVEDKK